LKKLREELKVSTKNLEEMNVALDVLWRGKNRQKAEVEKKVMANISQLVGPYLQDLRSTKLDERQKAFISMLEANLAEVTSSFLHKLAAADAILTPTELKVANMVKEGKTSKEIARLLNLAIKTIDSHRARIRQKLGIKDKKTNLRTHLLTLK
jgi:DNA-binding CsgD family transcriptional regulator